MCALRQCATFIVVFVHIFSCDFFRIAFYTKLKLMAVIKFLAGMKVYITDEKELIMEPSFKWAGNPNIIVAVKAFGLKATVQVIDLFMVC